MRSVPKDYIAFDGSWNISQNTGAWAVVLVKDGKEELLEYGILRDSDSMKAEFAAAERAAHWAEKKSIKTIRGDSKGCLGYMRWEFEDFLWEWVRSKGNPADKFAKYQFEELT